ncbi:S41 family peptidase [Planomonospora venezuelensis]|uniref:C-terminal processing protease CtpA/Prc n=1 Tax=Planomonospora venezuelensis TaxID=1999 RepID=A0A841DDW3_PLAVE|nr:S41 family peptidase [Planomonospora venezuelensis]MBB5967659.1 C-terminal processing protease CtpA/Prc [Planomonospora venezuelensis]GIN03566.1 interphotoreceptor retinoid-binding protein [Planomonospora venezuelensis]
MLKVDRSLHIDIISAQLLEYYVFPDVAREIADVLRARLAEGRYADLPDDEAFAAAVTEDLQSVNGDRHLRLLHNVDPIPEQEAAEFFDEALYRAEAELGGYGFARAERLDGNVGYLDTRAMVAAELAGHAAVAAMNLLASTDALIVDVRRNGGGDPRMVALLCSYLFDEPTHLNDIYDRPSGETAQSWTLPFVPGPRFGGSKPVYVLTSGTTFSGAEEFTYNLQTRGRATVVGERTRGGAHPGVRYRVDAHLKSAVPSGRAINPVTGTNWEGTGIVPDIGLPAAQAFDHAYGLALRHVLELGDGGARRAVAAEARAALARLS